MLAFLIKLVEQTVDFKRESKLIMEGQLVHATFTKAEPGRHKHPIYGTSYTIHCFVHDTDADKIHKFKARDLVYKNPGAFFEEEPHPIPVFIDPENQKNYHVELGELTKSLNDFWAE